MESTYLCDLEPVIIPRRPPNLPSVYKYTRNTHPNVRFQFRNIYVFIKGVESGFMLDSIETTQGYGNRNGGGVLEGKYSITIIFIS